MTSLSPLTQSQCPTLSLFGVLSASPKKFDGENGALLEAAAAEAPDVVVESCVMRPPAAERPSEDGRSGELGLSGDPGSMQLKPAGERSSSRLWKLGEDLP